MTNTSLSVFLTVVEEMSFTKAARQAIRDEYAEFNATMAETGL